MLKKRTQLNKIDENYDLFEQKTKIMIYFNIFFCKDQWIVSISNHPIVNSTIQEPWNLSIYNINYKVA